MEKLFIEETEDTPEIILDPEQNIFKISKISVPENALDFYKPVLDWIKNYAESPNVQTVFRPRICQHRIEQAGNPSYPPTPESGRKERRES